MAIPSENNLFTQIMREIEGQFSGTYVEKIEIFQPAQSLHGAKDLYLKIYFSHDYLLRQHVASIAGYLCERYYQFMSIRVDMRSAEDPYPQTMTLGPGSHLIPVNNSNGPFGFISPEQVQGLDGQYYVNGPYPYEYNQAAAYFQAVPPIPVIAEIPEPEPEPEATPAPPFEETTITLDDLF